MVRAASDELDTFVKTFNPERFNGIWPTLDLPADASPGQLTASVAKQEKPQDGNGAYLGYRIVETRKINQINSVLNNCIVVLIASAKGSKTILVFEPEQAPSRWRALPFYITTVP